MKATRNLVYAAINGERDYQDSHTLHDPEAPGFSTGDYITMLTHYANQLPAAWALNPGAAPPEVLHNMRKIAAIAVQCLEVHGVLPRSELGDWGRVSEIEKAKLAGQNPNDFAPDGKPYGDF